MEKIRDTISRKLPPLRLYLDEIRELYQFLAELTEEKVSIETSGFRLNSIDELSKLPNEIAHDIYFHTSEPYIRIRLTPSYGEIYIGEGGIKAEGIATRIEYITKPGKAYRPVLLNYTWASFIIGIPLAVGLGIGNKLLVISGLALIIISIVWVIAEAQYSIKRYNTIIFQLKKDAPRFWKRNKDQIIMLIIGAAIGVVTTVLGTILINMFK